MPATECQRPAIEEARDFTRLLLQADHFSSEYLQRSHPMIVSVPKTHVFCDESGKWQDKDFICLCAYLSDESGWGQFLDHWTELLYRHGFPNGLHMATFFTECRKRGLGEDRAKEILREFVDVIRAFVPIAFAIGMDARHYRGKLKSSQGMIADPAVVCLQRLLRKLRDRLAGEQYFGRIILHLDEDETYAVAFYKVIFRLRKYDPVLGGLIGSVCFADDTYALPLQAADLLANLTFGWFKDCITGKASAEEPPELIRRLLASPIPGYGNEYSSELWNAQALDEQWNEFRAPNTGSV